MVFSFFVIFFIAYFVGRKFHDPLRKEKMLKKQGYIECPYCRKMIDPRATVCPYCRRNLQTSHNRNKLYQ